MEAAINAISLIEGDNSKIILVGHSRGGLAATRFLQKGNSSVKNKVAGLVTTRTPHSGSRFGRLCGRSDILNILIKEEDLILRSPVYNALKYAAIKNIQKLLEKPSICYLSDLSTNISTMKNDMSNLPLNIKYSKVVYDGQWLGDLLFKDYNLFSIVSFWSPTLASHLEQELLAPETPESLQGDGIVDFNSQHLSKVLGSSNPRDIVTYPYRNTGTLHAQELEQVDHIGNAILVTIQRIN